jgi:hypothetical protein
MTGISGVKMWMEDYLINASTYDEKHRTNFIKIVREWDNCIKDYKECVTIEQCNDTYVKWCEKIDTLNEGIRNSFGEKIPCGISDTLDYFEDALGELEDIFIDKIREKMEGGR